MDAAPPPAPLGTEADSTLAAINDVSFPSPEPSPSSVISASPSPTPLLLSPLRSLSSVVRSPEFLAATDATLSPSHCCDELPSAADVEPSPSPRLKRKREDAQEAEQQEQEMFFEDAFDLLAASVSPPPVDVELVQAESEIVGGASLLPAVPGAIALTITTPTDIAVPELDQAALPTPKRACTNPSLSLQAVPIATGVANQSLLGGSNRRVLDSILGGLASSPPPVAPTSTLPALSSLSPAALVAGHPGMLAPKLPPRPLWLQEKLARLAPLQLAPLARLLPPAPAMPPAEVDSFPSYGGSGGGANSNAGVTIFNIQASYFDAKVEAAPAAECEVPPHTASPFYVTSPADEMNIDDNESEMESIGSLRQRRLSNAEESVCSSIYGGDTLSPSSAMTTGSCSASASMLLSHFAPASTSHAALSGFISASTTAPHSPMSSSRSTHCDATDDHPDLQSRKTSLCPAEDTIAEESELALKRLRAGEFSFEMETDADDFELI